MPFHYINVGHYTSYVGSRFQEFYAEKWCATKSKNLPSTFPKVTNVTSTHTKQRTLGQSDKIRIITSAMPLFYCITVFCCTLQCYTNTYCKKPNNNVATKEDYV